MQACLHLVQDRHFEMNATLQFAYRKREIVAINLGFYSF